ncbi:helix-turn-helix transcriptional regulator [Methylocystis echinoides]|uniref:Helix-turn-helix domain-containing protein n=1 Tax=Methylocystis echinoides TaxID=29468 RepID=A0A9W6LT25_9HYPH|nr:hypothetical protein [Methylocystis echinoides]GLI93939.1 hypothetical protein LMG27198_29310 [Methylocystis echinoides]
MANAEARSRLGIAPRLLRRERAAAYLDVSPTSFDKLVKEGKLPKPKRLDGFRWWDRVDLDASAESLPYEGDGAPDDSWND